MDATARLNAVESLAGLNIKARGTQRIIFYTLAAIAVMGCSDDETAATKESLPRAVESLTGWKHYKHIDKFNDSTSFIAELPAKAIGIAAAETPVLVAICDGRNTSAFIDWRRFIGIDKIYVASRLDKNSARYEESEISKNNQATYMLDAALKLKELLQEKGEVLIASVQPDGGPEVFAEFELAGAADALKDIRAACNW